MRWYLLAATVTLRTGKIIEWPLAKFATKWCIKTLIYMNNQPSGVTLGN